jgi:hypothetical protein
MTNKILASIVWIFLMFAVVPAVYSAAEDEQSALAQTDLSQFIYSYGTVLKVSDASITLQEYDYDSDVEKEITYQINAETKLEGLKAVSELVAEDVVEIYYLEQNGQRTAKIIHREVIEDDAAANNGAEL